MVSNQDSHAKEGREQQLLLHKQSMYVASINLHNYTTYFSHRVIVIHKFGNKTEHTLLELEIYVWDNWFA